MKKLLLGLSLLSLGAALYADQEQWQLNWFRGIGDNPVSISNLDSVNGSWSGLTADNAALTSKKLVLDVGAGEAVSFSPTAVAADSATAQQVTIKAVCTPIVAAKLPTDATMAQNGAQVGFALQDDGDGTYSYVGWVGSGWVTLGDAPAAVVDTELTVKVSLAYWTSAVSATFSVGGVVVGNAQTVTAAAKGNGRISGIGCMGSGTIAAIDGDAQYGVASVGGRKYGTADAAIQAAQSGQTVNVEREVQGEVKAKEGVIIADNGYVNGGIDVSDVTEVKIAPQVEVFEQAGVIGASGVYNLTVTVDKSKATLVLPGEIGNYKQATVLDPIAGGKSQVRLETKDEFIPGSAANRGKMRTFLATHANAAYVAPTATDTTLNAALAATVGNVTLAQAYALGINPSDSIAPQPVQAGGEESGYVALSIPAIGQQEWADNDYTVSYSVYRGDTLVKSELTAPKVPVSGEGGVYTLKVVTTPKQ